MKGFNIIIKILVVGKGGLSFNVNVFKHTWVYYFHKLYFILAY